jgi:hypothetical protein
LYITQGDLTVKPPADNSMTFLGATVRPDQVSYLAQVKASTGAPLSFVVRAALDLYIKHHPLSGPCENATIAASS